MQEAHYISPYRYDGSSYVWTKKKEIQSSDIPDLIQDSTLSTLDYRIMHILYRLRFAPRNGIEEELMREPETRMPKDLKRTLRHLLEEGILYGIGQQGGNIRFYCLSPAAQEYISKHGGTTDIDCDMHSVHEMLVVMAYNQFSMAAVPMFGRRILKHERRHRMYGAEGTFTVDGYMELIREKLLEYLYIIVIRSGPGWMEDAEDDYRRLARYTCGIPNSSCLFLCEDSVQVQQLSLALNDSFEENTPHRFYTYDTLIFQRQKDQHVIVCEDNSLQYGTLKL